MERRELPPTVVRIKKNKEMPHTYDVDLGNVLQAKEYTSLECHLFLYPYSRKIHAKNITFSPYEEYVKDISSRQRSAYVETTSQFDKVFGLFLGFLIVLIFFAFNPKELGSIESIVSVLGAYIIGKELWDDLEKILVNVSKDWRIRYLETYYVYQLQKHSTSTHYFYRAKKHRYGRAHLLPEKVDFIQQSNSQTVRMYFNTTDFPSREDSAHILSVQVTPRLLEDFEKDGFMFGVKLSFNKGSLFKRCFELFQSLDKDSKGCLDGKNEWVEGGVFYRETFVLGKVKYFKKEGVIDEKSVIEYNGT